MRRQEITRKALDPQVQQEELFERASWGEITGAEADAEAIRLGLGSLSTIPPASEFDPKKERYWSLPMAVAWIAYRDLDEVRRWWGRYREQYTYWSSAVAGLTPAGEVRMGWYLKTLSAPTLALLGLAESISDRSDGNPKFSMSVSEARQALWAALQSDCFRASATYDGMGYHQEIEPVKWINLRCVERHGTDQLIPANEIFREEGAYTDVLLPSAALRGLWRAPFVEEPATLPTQVSPRCDGYMPLYFAAQWIATEGGALSFEPRNVSVWRTAFASLLDTIAAGKIAVFGIRDGNREPVPSFQFIDCSVDYPFDEDSANLMFGDEIYLRSHPYVSAERWRQGFDDSLVSRRKTLWSRLMVSKADVRSSWPFEDEGDAKTGLPGRPSPASHLIRDELEKRASSGTLEISMREQARVLVDWLAKAHPAKPRPTQKTIENQIRNRFRQLRAPK